MRLYSPVLGRFLSSADYVSDPTYSQAAWDWNSEYTASGKIFFDRYRATLSADALEARDDQLHLASSVFDDNTDMTVYRLSAPDTYATQLREAVKLIEQPSAVAHMTRIWLTRNYNHPVAYVWRTFTETGHSPFTTYVADYLPH